MEKLMTDILKKNYGKFMIDRCDDDKIIKNIMHNQEHIPVIPPKEAREIKCIRCGSSEGFYIPFLNTWSCSSNDCIYYNAKKKVPSTKKRNVIEHGVAMEYKNACLKNCNQTAHIVECLRIFATNPKGYFVLSGTNGTGKTYAACACMDEYLNIGHNDCRFYNFSDLYSLWIQGKELDSCIGFINELKNWKLLILDDLGIRTPTDAFLEFLYNLLDKRHSNGMGTIITTNLSGKQVREKFGDAIFSRISSGQCFKIEGNDRRFDKF